MLEKYAKNPFLYLKKQLNRKDAILLVVSLFMGVYFKWNIFETAVFLIFIFAVLHPFPSRYAAFPAVFFLTLAPFFLVFKKDSLAEQLAIYAYYFLIITVVLAIYEIKLKK